jgi:hypothetical protein
MLMRKWKKIMSKTNETCNLSHDALDDHRPLADSELDAVTGGLSITKQLDAASAKAGDGGGGGGGNAGPAIAAWNTLLHQYGAA